MRVETIEKMRALVTSDRDILSEVVSWALDDALDMQLRLSAASIALPYLFPRLSASQVDARHVVTTVDSAALLDRIAQRIEALAAPDLAASSDKVAA
jgi:hypothetical protein